VHNWQQQLKPLKPLQTDAHAMDLLVTQLMQAQATLNTPQNLVAQSALEEVLALTLLLLDRLQVNAEHALNRVATRWKTQPTDKKRFRVYPDFVEVWVGHEYRGGWPLTGDEDLNRLEHLAAELDCQLEYSHTRQLSLLP
jgi:hypothetical protein